MKEYQLTDKETNKFKKLNQRAQALDALMSRCIGESEAIVEERERLFGELRSKYRTQPHTMLTVDHATGNMIEEEIEHKSPEDGEKGDE